VQRKKICCNCKWFVSKTIEDEDNYTEQEIYMDYCDNPESEGFGRETSAWYACDKWSNNDN